MNPVIKKIVTRGYWKFIIHPKKCLDDGVLSIPDLPDTIKQLAVSLRGWDFPHWNSRENPTIGDRCAEQTTDWRNHIEFWRYCQSGQFIHYSALWIDWMDARPDIPNEHEPPGSVLHYLDTVYTLTEMYEFAARLATRGLLADECVLEVDLVGTKNRHIISPGRSLWGPYECKLDHVLLSKNLVSEHLIAESANLALAHAEHIFHHFNWLSIRAEAMREDQNKLLEKRL